MGTYAVEKIFTFVASSSQCRLYPRVEDPHPRCEGERFTAE